MSTHNHEAFYSACIIRFRLKLIHHLCDVFWLKPSGPKHQRQNNHWIIYLTRLIWRFDEIKFIMYIGQFDNDYTMKSYTARLDTFKDSKWPFSDGSCTPEKVKIFKIILCYEDKIFELWTYISDGRSRIVFSWRRKWATFSSLLLLSKRTWWLGNHGCSMGCS